MSRWLAVVAVAVAVAVAAALPCRRRGPAPRVGAGPGCPVSRPDQPLSGRTCWASPGDTWKFYQADIDPATHLPMDNLTFAGGSATPTAYGRYTSAANIGVYLWAVVSARDLGLVSRAAGPRLVGRR